MRTRLLAAASALLTLTGLVTVVSVATAPGAAAYPSSSVTISGHGFGHGRGMGQWGAYGYATRAGWGAATILSHYYGGAVVRDVGNPTMTVRLTALDGAVLGPVTAGRDFTAGGVRVAAGSTATISVDGGGFVLTTSAGCGQQAVWSTRVPSGRIAPAAYLAGADRSGLLTRCGGSAYRGNLDLVPADGSLRTVNALSLDDYLRGVVPRESPSGWGDTGGQAALDAQAVAARSYSMSENRYSYAKTCDTESCQVYGGASGETTNGERAVVNTSGDVLTGPSGAPLRAEFSSSTGGWTAGGTFPAVRDDGDAASPYASWSVSVPVSTVEQRFDVGQLQDLRVTRRNGLGADGGRVLEVQVVGSARTVTVSGNAVRTALGLRSDWFSFPVGTSSFYLASPAGSAATIGVSFGDRGDTAFSCDVDGDGLDNVGVFRQGTWFFRTSNATGPADLSLRFGQAGDQPFCTDTDGDGNDELGLFREGSVYLRGQLSSGPAEHTFRFGAPGDRVVVGDWDGDGRDSTGVVRAGRWYLGNDPWSGTLAGQLDFGEAGDLPVAGDWDADGYSTPGVVRAGRWYLSSSNLRPTTSSTFAYGDAGDQVVSGRWFGGARDGVGVARW